MRICHKEDVARRFAAPDGSLIALVDCDSFYASCEKAARPDLRDRPVVVLSNNDGCVVARSREAKALGVPMGEPEFKLRPLLEKLGAAVFSSNYALYGDLSRRVMETVASVAPEMEIYSIDEAFVRLRGPQALGADEVAALIRRRVLRWVGLPVSVGVAPTKALAKIAVAVAKKRPEYEGVFDLSAYGDVDRILDVVPIGDVWGVGRESSRKLRLRGIYTARQLRDAEPAMIRSLLTITGLNLRMELNGVPAIREEIPLTHTSVVSSRSLGRKTSDLPTLLEAVAFHAARAGEKLRARGLVCGAVCVRMRTADYAEDQPRTDDSIMVRLRRATFDTAVLIGAARAGARKIYRAGYAYAKVMVMLVDLSEPAKSQASLLDIVYGDEARDEKRRTLMELMDRVNRTRGRGTLTFASQGRADADWHMKRGRLSPAWTTNVDELLTARCEPSARPAGVDAR